MKKQGIFIIVFVILISLMTPTVLAAEIFISPSDYGFVGLEEMEGSFSYKVMRFTGEQGANKYDMTFTVPEDGDYRMWARVYHEIPDDNSIFYYDGGTEFIFDAYQPWGDSMFDKDEVFSDELYYNNFYWIIVGERDADAIPWNIDHIFKLKAGTNTFTVANREEGFVIDMFILTNDPNYDPRQIDGDPKPPEEAVVPVAEEAVSAAEPEIVNLPAEIIPVAQVTAPQTSDANFILLNIILAVSATALLVTLKKAKISK
jgi:hypothetical protein